MRYFLAIIILIFFISCDSDNINDKSKRNENWAWWIDAKTIKGQWIPLSENPTWDNGKYTMFYSNGAVYEKGKIENGKNVDTIFSFDKNGKLFAYKIIKDDKVVDYFIKDGWITINRQDGNISTQGVVQNHLRGNNWVSYFENGNKKLVMDFTKDTGWQVSYFENGSVQDSSFRLKGYDSVYPIKSWYDNGNIAEIKHWKNRLRNGVSLTYYRNGVMKDSCNFIDGKRDGIAKQWFTNGRIKAYAEIKNDKPDGVIKEYDENGQVTQIGLYKAGLKIK